MKDIIEDNPRSAAEINALRSSVIQVNKTVTTLLNSYVSKLLDEFIKVENSWEPLK